MIKTAHKRIAFDRFGATVALLELLVASDDGDMVNQLEALGHHQLEHRTNGHKALFLRPTVAHVNPKIPIWS